VERKSHFRYSALLDTLRCLTPDSPADPYHGRRRVFATYKRGWEKLCRLHPGVMERVYWELADNPYSRTYAVHHHRMAGCLRDFWEIEVSGGERVRCRRGADGDPTVVYAGPAPPDTH
jgi:hypothetical protein